MSILRSAWAPIGEWFTTVCILAPIVIALIGLLITLISLALAATGVGASVAAVLETIAIVLAIICVVLMFGGALCIGWMFVTDMWTNFLGNLWTSGLSGAWNGLKSDVSSCAKWFVSGAQKAVAPLRPYVAPVVAGAKAWWKTFRKVVGF